MSDTLNIVTIDGPSGVGKSTVSRRLAARLGFTYLDTGAMYRTVALRCDQLGIDPNDEQAVSGVLEKLDMLFLPAASMDEEMRVIMEGVDITGEIRSPEISMLASTVSAHRQVRLKLTEMQQKMGRKEQIVAEGRDMGTVVFPNAAWKFYLDADPGERARRRIDQLKSRGVEVDEDEILEQIIARDRDDRERTIAPLKMAEDAVVVDSTSRNADEVINLMLSVIKGEGVSSG